MRTLKCPACRELADNEGNLIEFRPPGDLIAFQPPANPDGTLPDWDSHPITQWEKRKCTVCGWTPAEFRAVTSVFDEVMEAEGENSNFEKFEGSLAQEARKVSEEDPDDGAVRALFALVGVANRYAAERDWSEYLGIFSPQWSEFVARRLVEELAPPTEHEAIRQAATDLGLHPKITPKHRRR